MRGKAQVSSKGLDAQHESGRHRTQRVGIGLGKGLHKLEIIGHKALSYGETQATPYSDERALEP